MLPNLHSVFQVTELRRQEMLAAVAQNRAARDHIAGSRKRRVAAAPRQRIGATLIRVGQRLAVDVGAP